MQIYNFIKKLIIIALLFTFSCKKNNYTSFDNNNVKYAYYFNFYKIQNKIIVDIIKKNGQKQQFIFTKDIKNSPKPNEIKIPINKLICLSTTHIGFIKALNEQNSVVGLSGLNYVYDSLIREKIKNNLIYDVGFETSLNIETILSLKPDLVLAYDLDGTMTHLFNILNKNSIPVIEVNEYLENHPLGRAEWIKFFGILFDKEKQANELFNYVAQSYDSIKKTIDKKVKPNVAVNIPFNGIWFTPGGQSYFAKLIEDAGGNYIFKNFNTNQSVPIQIETIFEKIDSIDILLNPSSYTSKKQIIVSDKRLKKIIEKVKIYNNNKKTNGLANDFWESGVVFPNLILEDLKKCFSGDTTEKCYYQEIR